jgi:hypothetical protein
LNKKDQDCDACKLEFFQSHFVHGDDIFYLTTFCQLMVRAFTKGCSHAQHKKLIKTPSRVSTTKASLIARFVDPPFLSNNTTIVHLEKGCTIINKKAYFIGPWSFLPDQDAIK